MNLNQDAMLAKSDAATSSAERLNHWLTAAVVAALVLGIFASSWLTGRLLLPLDSLSQAAHRLGEGDLDARAAVRGKDEVGRVAEELNQMAERLGQYRKSSLGELLQAQQASQSAIDSIPDPVMVFDVTGKIIEINEAGEQLLGLADVQVWDRPLERAAPALREAIQSVRSHVLGGKGAYASKGFEEVVRADSAEAERYLLPRATPMYGEEGEIAGVTVLLQDVTRLRRFDELKKDVVATVAHEFRAPLGSLRMAIHMAAEQAAGPLTDKQLDLMQAAREDCDRLQTIVDDLGDLSKLEAGKIDMHTRPELPARLVNDAVATHASQARQERVKLIAEASPTLPEVPLDRDRIQLVFSHLIGNALHHSPEGGTVTVRAALADRAIRFEVVDTGPGIPAQYLHRIFDRFYRGPNEPAGGSGLGLSIAKEIVEAHGGRIGTESVVGEGATFWFTVPMG